MFLGDTGRCTSDSLIGWPHKLPSSDCPLCPPTQGALDFISLDRICCSLQIWTETLKYLSALVLVLGHTSLLSLLHDLPSHWLLCNPCQQCACIPLPKVHPPLQQRLEGTWNMLTSINFHGMETRISRLRSNVCAFGQYAQWDELLCVYRELWKRTRLRIGIYPPTKVKYTTAFCHIFLAWSLGIKREAGKMKPVMSEASYCSLFPYIKGNEFPSLTNPSHSTWYSTDQ